MTTHPNLDPITLEIVLNALRSITDETFIALTKEPIPQTSRNDAIIQRHLRS